MMENMDPEAMQDAIDAASGN